MSTWTTEISEAEIDAALADAADGSFRPRATSAEYNEQFDMVVVRLDDGRRLLVPREDLLGLENATPEQLTRVEVRWGADIGWWDLDVHHHIELLLERYGSKLPALTRQRQVAA